MSIRSRGLLVVLGGGVVFVFVLLFVMNGGLDSSRGGAGFVILLCTPGGLVLVGLIELITGIQFMKLSDAWDNLRGWQRGVLGAATFILACLIVFGGLALYVYLTAA